MAQIPRSLLDGLTDELNALSSAGRQMVENAVARLAPQYAGSDGLIPRENVASFRAAVVEVMDAVCGEMADLSAARTAEFYEQVRKISTGQQYEAQALHGRKPGATAGAVRALVQSVVDTGTTERFARDLGDRVDYEVKRSSGECVEENGRRDPADVRYARVPAGAETCAFCTMLASRGFVYHSATTAGADGHYHANCDCRIVPGFDTFYAGTSRRMSASTTVEGYDPDALYDQYVDDLHTGRLKLKDVNGSTSHVLHWRSEQFESYGDFSRFINEAEDIEDLQLRCAVAEQEWGKTGLSGRYYAQLRQVVGRKRREIDEAESLSSSGFELPSKSEIVANSRKKSDEFGDGMRSAWSRFASGDKTAERYEQTVGRFISNIGEEHKCGISASYVRNNKGKLIFANPDGDEIWASIIVASNYEESATFLPSDRSLTPDVKTANGFAEIKTPRSVSKVARRLDHAAEQLRDATGSKTVYLSLLRIDDEDAAIDIARRFVNDGTIDNIVIIHGDGTTESL